MKRYKLIKDLPTFSAGDVFELRSDGLWRTGNGHDKNHQKDVMAYHQSTLKRFPNILGNWFEEAEEPKRYWQIFGTNIIKSQAGLDELDDKINKEIGNYFESREEAEKAVKKPKAWKRLRDKGFRFKGYTRKFEGFRRVDGSVFIVAELDDEGVIGMIDELNICFGGEE